MCNLYCVFFLDPIVLYLTIILFKYVLIVLTPICFVRVSCFIYVFFCVFIYVFWSPTRFPYQMMFVSFNSNTTGATCGAGTVKPFGLEFTLGFSVVRVTRSLLFCVVFCRSLFVLLSNFFWPLCCLSFFDLRLLIIPLISSNLPKLIVLVKQT